MLKPLALIALTVLGPAVLGQDAGVEGPRLRTFTQKDFAGSCGEKEKQVAACLRDAHFNTLFPQGLVIGDPDGVDGDESYAVRLESAEAVANFLPKTGDPSMLAQDFTDPRQGQKGTGGAFAGQLVAAKLNLALTEAGLIEGVTSYSARDLMLDEGADEALRGLSVAEVVALADRAVSGAFGEAGGMKNTVVDVNGDGVADVTPNQLFSQLKDFNMKLAEGRVSNLVALRPAASIGDRVADATSGGIATLGDASTRGKDLIAGEASKREQDADLGETAREVASAGEDVDRGETAREVASAGEGAAERTREGIGSARGVLGTRGGDVARDADASTRGDRREHGDADDGGLGREDDRSRDDDGSGDDESDDWDEDSEWDGGQDKPGRGRALGHEKTRGHLGKVEARSELVRVQRAREGDGGGVIRLQADPKKGRQRFEVKFKSSIAQSHDLYMESSRGSGEYRLVGKLQAERGRGNVDVSFVADSRKGSALPLGAANLSELSGRMIEIRAERQVVFSGTVPKIDVGHRAEEPGRSRENGRERENGLEKDKGRDRGGR